MRKVDCYCCHAVGTCALWSANHRLALTCVAYYSNSPHQTQVANNSDQMADITHEQVVQAHREYTAGRHAEVERKRDACIALMLDRLLRIGASDITEDVHFTANLVCTPDFVGRIVHRLHEAGFSVIPFDPRVSCVGWEIDIGSNQTRVCKHLHNGLNIIVLNTWTSRLVTVQSE